jgi:dephospho-CoA kinase
VAQNIIAIIGARRVGKTYLAEIAQLFFSDAKRISPDTHLILDFLELHEMSATEFYDRQMHEENRRLLYLFKELQHNKYPNKYSNYFLNEIQTSIQSGTPLIIDNIYYFRDLAILIEHKAQIILVEAPHNKRTEFGYTNNMDLQFFTKEVASVTNQDVRKWNNTIVIKNDSSAHDLKVKLRNLI